MLIRNFLIRIAANAICAVRFRTLAARSARFIVFTGTSGKTLARTATAYALREAGFKVISPPFGYTNELGITLAALGIESMRLFSWAGLRKVMMSQAPEHAYILIELSADWRSDVSWFLRRFSPYGVCITSVSSSEWTRPISDIWKDKERLTKSILNTGFVVWSAGNESVPHIKDVKIASKARLIEFKSLPVGTSSFEYQILGNSYPIASHLIKFTPYAEAFGFAVSCLAFIRGAQAIPKDFFASYHPPPERFSETILPTGAMLISDTYKAVPQCMTYVLGTALTTPAERRIAVVSAMHPLWKNSRQHYETMAGLLSRFDQIYFIGPSRIGKLLCAFETRVVALGESFDIEKLARELALESSPGTLVVIKGAGRYRLGQLVTELENI